MHRRSRRLAAAAISAVVPGSGHLLIGKWKSGAAYITVTLGVTAMAYWLLLRSPATVVGWLVQPMVIAGLIVANVVVLVARLGIAIDAYRRPADTRSRQLATAATTAPTAGDLAVWDRIRRAIVSVAVGLTLAVILAAVAAPHVGAGYYLARTQSMIASVFVNEPAGSSAQFRVAALLGIGEPDRVGRTVAGGPLPKVIDDDEQDHDAGESSDTTDGDGDGDSEAGESTDEELEALNDYLAGAVDLPVNPWVDSGRLTVAVIGVDAGPGRFSARSDAMLIISVDARTGDAAVFSIDRYMRHFPVPDRWQSLHEETCETGGSWDYLNAVYTCATRRAPDEFAELYPGTADPAAAAVTEVLALMTGVDIPHYALVDMEGFVRVVDALGGVDVNVATDITVRISPAHDGTDWRTFHIPAGVQRLDGETALAYVRMRDPGDAGRMRRQRCLVSSLAQRADLPTVLARFGALTTAVEQHVTTNIAVSALPDLLQVLARVEPDRLVGVGFGPPTYRGARHAPEIDLIHARVRQVLDDPAAAIEAGSTTEAADQICR
ncbi:MAG: LCP family protein [Nitriliruptoraceae bacterium]